jgi:hypothetical protein
MKTNSLFWAMSWVAVGSFAIMQGCGGDDDDEGGGDGNGGKGGSSGSSTGGSATGGSATGGRGGSTTGGSSTGGSTTGGSSGAAGAPGGAGGDDTGGGGEGGSGGQTRGELCVEYCSVYFANACNTSVNPANTYADQPTCEFVCANTLTWEIGEEGVPGNTIWCRLDHANNAEETAMRAAHCGHASENPTAVCVD